MTPLDDELRSTLRAHAGDVQPAPDPLGGIETRARGMRRRRTALAATGTALAVAAVALAVPALLDRDRTGGGTQFASSSPTVTSSSAALDPARPWAFRGTPLSAGLLASFQDAWAGAHPGSTLTVLFAQVYEPSQQPEAVFVASGPDGHRYGYLRSLNKGIEITVDQPLPAATTALTVELPGDTVPRLLVLAAPDSKTVLYAANGTSFSPIDGPGRCIANDQVTPCAGSDGPYGVGVTPLEGDAAKARVRVIGADGSTVFDQPARPESSSKLPTNLLADWPQRGSLADGPDGTEVVKAFAASQGKPADQARYRALYTGNTDSGVRFTIGQAWIDGEDSAHTFGYATGGTNGPVPFLGPVTPTTPPLVALVIGSLPGTTTDLLIVVPTPRTGQVSYDTDGSGAFTPVTGQDHLDGVVLIDRDPRASNDRLEVLDGNGNLDQPNYRGPVAPFLCAAKECG